MSVTWTPTSRSSTADDRRSRCQQPYSGSEKVTLDNFWPDARPFICLVVILGIIVYLVLWN
jgi:hypothetical protein